MLRVDYINQKLNPFNMTKATSLSIFIPLFFTLFIISSCQSKKVLISSPTDNIDWIVGNWKRVNDQPNKSTFEKWQKLSSGQYLGIGYTMENKDTVFREDLALIKINGVWNLKVSGVHDHSVLFPFTKQSKSEFLCENPENDFPKMIYYRRENDRLQATISAGNDKVEFIFMKEKI